MRLLKSPAIKASEISAIFLPEKSHEFCDRLELLLQKKQAGNNSGIMNEETFAVADKLIEYKSISTKEHKFSLVECFNYKNTMK